jgi:hypothetical protein
MADSKAMNQTICLSFAFFGMKPDNTTGHKDGSQNILIAHFNMQDSCISYTSSLSHTQTHRGNYTVPL